MIIILLEQFWEGEKESCYITIESSDNKKRANLEMCDFFFFNVGCITWTVILALS